MIYNLVTAAAAATGRRCAGSSGLPQKLPRQSIKGEDVAVGGAASKRSGEGGETERQRVRSLVLPRGWVRQAEAVLRPSLPAHGVAGTGRSDLQRSPPAPSCLKPSAQAQHTTPGQGESHAAAYCARLFSQFFSRQQSP